MRTRSIGLQPRRWGRSQFVLLLAVSLVWAAVAAVPASAAADTSTLLYPLPDDRTPDDGDPSNDGLPEESQIRLRGALTEITQTARQQLEAIKFSQLLQPPPTQPEASPRL